MTRTGACDDGGVPRSSRWMRVARSPAAPRTARTEIRSPGLTLARPKFGSAAGLRSSNCVVVVTTISCPPTTSVPATGSTASATPSIETAGASSNSTLVATITPCATRPSTSTLTPSRSDSGTPFSNVAARASTARPLTRKLPTFANALTKPSTSTRLASGPGDAGTTISVSAIRRPEAASCMPRAVSVIPGASGDGTVPGISRE